MGYEWRLNEDILEIDWDSNKTMEQIRDRVHYLLKRCGYKVAITSTVSVVQGAHAVIERTPSIRLVLRWTLKRITLSATEEYRRGGF